MRNIWRFGTNTSLHQGPDDRAGVYNNFILLESVYALTFMTWSDSVWRLDEKPEKFAGKLE